MNKSTESLKNKHYETPEIQDIAPVSIVRCQGTSDAGDGDNDGGGE